MQGTSAKTTSRRKQVREQRTKALGSIWARILVRGRSWPFIVGLAFTVGACAIAMWGGESVRYSIGQRIDRPIIALVQFHVRDETQTQKNRETARRSCPSHYVAGDSVDTIDRVRRDLGELYKTATEADSYDGFAAAMGQRNWPASRNAYDKLREWVGDRSKFDECTDRMSWLRVYVIAGDSVESRLPPGNSDHILLATVDEAGVTGTRTIQKHDLVYQESMARLTDCARGLVEPFPYQLKSTAQAIVLNALSAHPTLRYDKGTTDAAIAAAAAAVPDATSTFEKGQTFIEPHKSGEKGGLTAVQYELLEAHQTAYFELMRGDAPEAIGLRRERLLERAGLSILVAFLSIALCVYTVANQPAIFRNASRSLAFFAVLLGMLFVVKLVDREWPQLPELVLTPCLLAGCILAIVCPQRFALGIMSIVAVLATTVVRGNLTFLLTLVTGLAVMIYQLDEIRSRTKIIATGTVAAIAVAIVAAAGGLLERQSIEFVRNHALWAAGCAMMAGFLVSGILPFIERLFQVATSLTLLEWRDPTKPLLQLLAREAPGTYNHSLVLGTLAEAACGRIGANGLLAQVGALYHDIGKIHKAHYFAENQEGGISRHENLAPTMSLLIILGHVKDGIEMAKEYKLPRALYPFIEEHHGTTVIRYFHHMASEKQPRIASGKHDREVPESEFRYAGPKPRSKATAVLMLCDGVEGAVRALPEATVGRIEGVVHQIVMDRLNDGQFNECDITLREIHLVEESLVKSLCSIYHGRVAYPKGRKTEEQQGVQGKVIV